MQYSVRDFVYVGVFAGCWGAIEITLGSLLHTLNVPLTGAFLTGAGIAMALVGRLFVPKPGSIFLIAMVTALLKMLSVGGIILSPMIAITVEGAIAEAAILAAGPSRIGFVAAAGLSCLWPIVHSTLSMWISGGTGFFQAYLRVLERGANALGVPMTWGFGVLAVLAGVHLAIGIVSGLTAWRIGQGLRKRGRDWNKDTHRA